MFGAIDSVLSTYRTNAYSLHVFHVGSLGYLLSCKGRVSKVSKKRRLVSPHIVQGLPPLCCLYFFLYVTILWAVTQDYYIHDVIDDL